MVWAQGRKGCSDCDCLVSPGSPDVLAKGHLYPEIGMGRVLVSREGSSKMSAGVAVEQARRAHWKTCRG